MNISNFRYNLREAFDSALKDEVLIERGGVQFSLKAKGVIGTVYEAPPFDRTENVPIKNIKVNDDGTISPKVLGKSSSFDTRAANGLCKIHGLPLDGRGRCLQKGCKYA